jgi:hypothetical protein
VGLKQAFLQTPFPAAAVKTGFCCPVACMVCCCRELICKVAEIHITIRKHLAKEEAQLLPLLLQHFSAAEQAELVAQFLYCIPLDTVERVLSWLKPMVPLQELQELMTHLRDVIPDRLLLQLLVTWLNPAPPRGAAPAAAGAGAVAATGAVAVTVPSAVAVVGSSPDGSCMLGVGPAGPDAAAVAAHAAAVAAAVAAAQASSNAGQERMVICPFAAGASKQQGLQAAAVAAAGGQSSTSQATAAGSHLQQKWPPLRVSRDLAQHLQAPPKCSRRHVACYGLGFRVWSFRSTVLPCTRLHSCSCQASFSQAHFWPAVPVLSPLFAVPADHCAVPP